MKNEPDTLAFRNQLDALCLNFVADFKRRDARACAEGYTEDAVVIFPGSSPIRGRVEIAAAFQASMDAGVEISGVTVVQAEADGRVGYAIETVHGNRGKGTALIALRCDAEGNWLVCSEAAPDA